VVTIGIAEGELSGSRGGIHVGLLVESGHESASPLQRTVEIIHTEKQQ
jgi:hypothetical protein